MINIILFGPPGSGKGTQAQRLKEQFNLIHISTGDLLRSEKANETPLGLEAKNFMDKGLLVPDEIIIGMISSQIDVHQDANGIICDGFPRTTAQAEALDNLLDLKESSIKALIELEVSEDELIQRLSLRGETSGRADDQDLETIKHRIEVYRNETAPVAEYYQEKEKYMAVNGEGNIDDVYNRLQDIFQEFE